MEASTEKKKEYSYPYQEERLLKLVIQPNYHKNGRTYNNTKSWGII